jgi:hypothetical protein
MVIRCPRHPRLSQLLGCLAVALAVAAPAALSSTAAAADKTFRLEELVTDATVLPDASMQVTEQWTYRFEGGPFNFGIRSFEQNTDQITDFTASDEQGPLTVIAPDESVSGDWEWQLREPTSDRTVTFTVGYRVIDALRVGADVADLNWKFLGSEHPGVGDVQITVRMPGSVPPAPPGVADDDATYDLTNIGTLFAFLLVCLGVLVLRRTDPDRPRPFRVPFVWAVAPLGVLACLLTIANLPPMAWVRFAVWMAIGVAVYACYGRRHSVLGQRLAAQAGPESVRTS